MANAIFDVPCPENEPVLGYAPGSPERAELERRLEKMPAETTEIPLVIGGRDVFTGKKGQCLVPHDHRRSLAAYHKAGASETLQAVEAAKYAWPEWSRMPWEVRTAIFLKAAELLSRGRRAEMNAAAMLDLGKTVHQSEIDAVCELTDYWRFNPYYLVQVMRSQPWSAPGEWNMVEPRALEGFVFAVTPFNFASIAGNLPTAPAMMGNTVVWKPASSAVYTAHRIFRVLQEAGLPPGVINFVPGDGPDVGEPALTHPDLAGVHFTGSTATLRGIWKTLGDNISRYKSYPRLVGESGGKGFVFAHVSADIRALVVALVRGSFEYQGQKCSAATRAYVPRSSWPEVKAGLLDELAAIRMGDVADFRNFMGAVIDEAAFRKIRGYLDLAKSSPETRILAGGTADDKVGYFVAPTVILTENPRHRLMEEEIFGPVLTIYVYPDEAFEETLRICDATSPYGLTGSFFARDRRAIHAAARALRHAAGNFYINDKPTGAVVGHQPFGGGRASGTNDKAGSVLNLQRWVSPRLMKENFSPPTEVGYPFMAG
jgi:1-pyrroline-5-carboxylate dehydrogenase